MRDEEIRAMDENTRIAEEKTGETSLSRTGRWNWHWFVTILSLLLVTAGLTAGSALASLPRHAPVPTTERIYSAPHSSWAASSIGQISPGTVVTCTLIGSITNSDPSHTGVVNATGGPSTCATPKNCPGLFGSQQYHYDLYPYTNLLNTPQCINVLVDGSACGSGSPGLQANAYLNSFDPANLCNNYLADSGVDPITGQTSISFVVPARATFYIEVHQYQSSPGCASYSLSVTGDLAGASCPAQPTATPVPSNTPVPPATSTPLPCTPLGWTRLVNATVNGSSLFKTSPPNNWDSGATSNMQILNGYGQVEVIAGAIENTYMFGLNHGDPDAGFVNINYAMFVRGFQIDAYQDGVNIGNIGSYAPGDRLQIAVEQLPARVIYSKNGVALRTLLAQQPVFPLLLDTSIYNGRIESAQICGNLGPVTDFTPTATQTAAPTQTQGGPSATPIPTNTTTSTPSPTPTLRTPSPSPTPLTCSNLGWTRLVNAEVNGGSIFKTGPPNNWNSGATSNRQVLSGDADAIIVTNGLENTYVFGLSNGDPDPGYNNINYGMLVQGGQLSVYNNGGYLGNIGTYVPGDRLRISVSQRAGTVTYSRGTTVLLVLNNQSPTYPLLLDTSIYNGQIASALICSSNLAPVTDFTPTPPTQTPGGPTATTMPSNTRVPTNTARPTQTPGGPSATPDRSTPTQTIPPVSTPCPIQFNDAPSGSTFYSYIRCLACRNILGGYPCGASGEPCPGNYFRPNDNVTRGQAAKIISNAAGYTDQIPSTTQTFQDVASSSPFWVYVEWVYLHGAISGYPCGAPGEPCPGSYFRPGANLTRGQLAKIATSVAGYQDPAPATPSFSDVPTNSPFYIYIERAHTHNIISGYGCGAPGEPCPGSYYRPGLNVTRGQTAKIVSGTFFPNCQTP